MLVLREPASEKNSPKPNDEQEAPHWTPEQLAQNKKPEATREDKASKTTVRQTAGKGKTKVTKRQQPSPEAAVVRHKNPRRAALAAAAAARTAAAERSATASAAVPAASATTSAAAAATRPSANSVNVNDTVEPPHHVTRVRVFAPELDNLLFRSLLYDDKYTHVPPKIKLKKAGRGKPSAPKSNAKTAAPDKRPAATAGAAGLTTASYQRQPRFVIDSRTRLPLPTPGPALGALTEHLPLSQKAGKRPKNEAYVDGTRLGPSFGVAGGPSGILDGTAVTFGPRAIGPFRPGLAATMVEVGLVPDEVSKESGYSELAAVENKLKKEVERVPSAGGEPAAASGANPFGSSRADWKSRKPAGYARSQGTGGGNGGGGAAARRDSSYPHAGESERQGRQGSSSGVGGGARQTATGRSRAIMPNGKRRPLSRQMLYADHGKGGSTSEASPRAAPGYRRAGSSDRMSPNGREAFGGRSGGTGGARTSRRGGDHMDVEEDEEDNGYGGWGGNRRAPPISRNHGGGPSPASFRWEREEREKEIKENRRWNLKNMRAMDEPGKAEVCAYCRLRPDALMVCASQELAKIHSFCFPCLEAKEGIEKTRITSGAIKVCCAGGDEKAGAPPN